MGGFRPPPTPQMDTPSPRAPKNRTARNWTIAIIVVLGLIAIRALKKGTETTQDDLTPVNWSVYVRLNMASRQGGWKQTQSSEEIELYARVGSLVLVLFGFIAMVLFAVGTTSDMGEFWSVLASASIFALASSAAGGLAGFIFGVPRSQTGVRTKADAAGTGDDYELDITPNTNLEQISDWLTKILIGATLVQLTSIPATASRLFSAMAPALGGTDSSAAFAGGIVIYFSVLGFLIGWLNTRLYLGAFMRDADIRRSLKMATQASEEGRATDAARWLKRAQDLAVSKPPAE